jgi:carnitine O-acetyltransferase
MRVVTPEVLTFVSTMESTAPAPAKRAAFQAAAEAHVRRAKECQAGQAPEQHLWELQLIQRRRGDSLGVTEEPALFRSPGWLIMRDDYLSTSSAPSTSIQYFGFGSTSSHCIGVAYVLLPQRFNLYLSTPRAVADQMFAYAGHLRDAVRDLTALLAEPAVPASVTPVVPEARPAEPSPVPEVVPVPVPEAVPAAEAGPVPAAETGPGRGFWQRLFGRR